ncbi:MAG: hypothetical protein HGJ97_11280, partial [Desulfosporosinus sp.]|nr:hypothetical protein [Desulfosporosinus sp.]
MIDILSRRLLVRDDGSGKCREKLDGTLAEFESEDAIILLGDPGMGKTTIFRESAKEHYTTVRKFLIAPKVTFGSALFLDALDEYRTVASGHDVIAEVAKALCSLKKPKFRLSCRAADWFGTQDQEVLRVASASGRIVVLELCPLTRSEILSAVQGKVPDPVVFLHEVESKGLENLLGNPQTLELLACAWSGDKKPRNKFEAFEIGISKLIKEINVQHVPRGVNRFDHSDLLKAAGTAASIILLSNSVGISRSEPADGSGYVSHTVVPQELRQSLDIALKRRIFISTEVDRFEFPHRTIAEFLAAKDISNRIQNGLPINRVMALICIDGRPVSSLRGLFAWLMCMLGHLSTGYVKLDPYGVATYGDASVLAPDAQRQIWESLRDLHDPWFLTSEDNPGLFTELANLNTAEIIKKLIQDTTTSVHLKIAILEAIANSKDDIGITELIKDIVLDKDNNTWLRSTALKAFCKSVNYDRASLETLDFELANSLDDLDAPEVRVELLSINPKLGDWTKRLISTVEQVASAKKERLIFGRFYRLVTLPSDTDLDVVLDSASKVLMHKSPNRFELRSIFDGWLKRRLESPTLIMPSQLAKWLRNICLGRSRGSEKALALMKARFEQKPSLFEEVFYLLSNTNTNKERSFWLFVVHDLWQMLPETVWPVPHSEFFLTLAEKETDPQRAADLFRMYMNRFPSEGASVAFVESGINFLARRKDIAKIIGNWKSCKIEEHQKAEWRRSLKESRKQSINRAQNVASLTPLLMTIREGSEEHALAWAARVYQGFHTQVENVSNPLERLVNVTNEEIANALVEGLIRYVENPSIPKKEVVIESYFSNSIPWTHNLMCVSVYLLLNAGKRVPKEALPHCIAAVVTAYQIGDSVPGYNETLSKWIIQEVHENSFVVRSVLTEMWAYSARFKKGILPNFYELSKEPNSQRFLVSLSINVLNTGTNEDNYTVC